MTMASSILPEVKAYLDIEPVYHAAWMAVIELFAPKTMAWRRDGLTKEQIYEKFTDYQVPNDLWLPILDTADHLERKAQEVRA
jgi:hypothetical protein